MGRPNRITLPVDIKYKMGPSSDAFASKHASWNMRQVQLVCYNDLYPSMIMLDSEYLTKNMRFRLGDLQNILPAGLYVDPLYPNLNRPIVYF